MICLDIDGVLADTSATLRAHLCATLNLEPSGIPVVTDYYDMASVWPSEHRERVGILVREAFQHDAGGVYSTAEPLPYAATIAGILHGWNMVAGYVTRRPAGMLDVTQAWLAEHGLPDLPLLCAPSGTPKSRFVRDLGAVGMIEDSPTEALELAQAGLRVALMDWPYNRRVKHALVDRASDWSGLASHVLAWPEVRR